MLEMRLIALFAVSAAVILFNGIIIIKSCPTQKNSCKLTITATKEMEDIEWIVRTLVYKLVDKYPDILVVLIDIDADREKIYIFEKLMEKSCNYTIIKFEKNSENICNVIESMLY